MPTYNVSKTFPLQVTVTDKAAKVCRMFGVTTDRLNEKAVAINCRVEINPGDIVYITGPSGSGKTILLKELQAAVGAGDKINLNEIKLPRNKTLIDCFGGDLIASLKTLSCAGLNDVFVILNTPAHLSDGQKYRFRLAKALSAQKKFVFADEFCCQLDRITAGVISYHLHQFAKKTAPLSFWLQARMTF